MDFGWIEAVSNALQEDRQGVAQMDQITQSNAVNSKEAASAAEELSAQAKELSDMVNTLVAIVNGSLNGSNGSTSLGHNGAHAGRGALRTKERR